MKALFHSIRVTLQCGALIFVCTGLACKSSGNALAQIAGTVALHAAAAVVEQMMTPSQERVTASPRVASGTIRPSFESVNVRCFSGRVREAGGGTLADVSVTASYADEVVDELKTSGDGRFEVCVTLLADGRRAKHVLVHFSKPDFVDVEVPIPIHDAGDAYRSFRWIVPLLRHNTPKK